MAAPKEIERKFWVRQLPAFVPELPHSQIQQAYLALGSDGNEIRLRQKDDTYWLTIKTQGDLERSEYETPLSQQQFETLWPAIQPPIIHKTRYLWQREGYNIEVDVYQQTLKGLIVAEIEFPDKKSALQYQPEPWMDKDITHLNFMKNKNLLQFKNFDQVKNSLFS
jgi:adenylate cyclase